MTTLAVDKTLNRMNGCHGHFLARTVSIQRFDTKRMNALKRKRASGAALDFSATGGIPTRGLVEAGKVKVARIEHVWVEAWVDMIPSLGAKHVTGDTWVPLDASFKQYTYTEGMDISAEVPFDAEALVEDVIASATINEAEGYVTGLDSSIINTAMTQYRAQVEEYMSTQQPEATVGDVLGTKTIKEETQSILAGTLPYKLRAMGPRVSELPSELRHGIEFTMRPDEMNYEATHFEHFVSMPELAGKKVTISYAPATAADEAVINSYLPEPHPDGTPIDPSELPSSLPAYLINLKAELRIEGEVVATAGPYRMGTKQTTHMHFYDPVRGYESVSNCIYAGEYYGIAIDVGRVSKGMMEGVKARLESTKAKLEAEDFTGLTKDELLGDLLYSTAMTYLAELDVSDHIQSRKMDIIDIRFPSEAIFKTSLDVDSSFGMPMSAGVGSLAMDADRLLSMTKSRDGSKAKKLQFMQTSGMNSSALEHLISEQMFTTPENQGEAVSAVKAIQLASEQGIPVYTITQNNMHVIVPQLQLSPIVMDEIQNALYAGNVVTVSKTNIDFNGNSIAGYIITNPLTGEGAYMISSGESGATWWAAAVYAFWHTMTVVAYAARGAGIIAIGALLAITLAPVIASALTAIGSMLAQLAIVFSEVSLGLYVAGTSIIGALAESSAMFSFLLFLSGIYLACDAGMPPGEEGIPPDTNSIAVDACVVIVTTISLIVKAISGGKK